MKISLIKLSRQVWNEAKLVLALQVSRFETRLIRVFRYPEEGLPIRFIQTRSLARSARGKTGPETFPTTHL